MTTGRVCFSYIFRRHGENRDAALPIVSRGTILRQEQHGDCREENRKKGNDGFVVDNEEDALPWECWRRLSKGR